MTDCDFLGLGFAPEPDAGALVGVTDKFDAGFFESGAD